MSLPSRAFRASTWRRSRVVSHAARGPEQRRIWRTRNPVLPLPFRSVVLSGPLTRGRPIQGKSANLVAMTTRGLMLLHMVAVLTLAGLYATEQIAVLLGAALRASKSGEDGVA